MAPADDERDPEDPTLAEDVYEGLVSLILSNELPADARVNINALGKHDSMCRRRPSGKH